MVSSTSQEQNNASKTSWPSATGKIVEAIVLASGQSYFKADIVRQNVLALCVQQSSATPVKIADWQHQDRVSRKRNRNTGQTDTFLRSHFLKTKGSNYCTFHLLCQWSGWHNGKVSYRTKQWTLHKKDCYKCTKESIHKEVKSNCTLSTSLYKAIATFHSSIQIFVFSYYKIRNVQGIIS